MPRPIQQAVQGLSVAPSSVHSFGDRDIDIVSSKGAGVKAIGCLWGCDDHLSLKNASPEELLVNTEELMKYIKHHVI